MNHPTKVMDPEERVLGTHLSETQKDLNQLQLVSEMGAVFWDGVLSLWEGTLPPASSAGTELDYRTCSFGIEKTTHNNP